MTVKYGAHYSKRQTPQSEPIPGEAMVANNAGGYAYALDKWARLQRFLILGTDGGTYYVREKPLTRENALVVEACLAEDALRTIGVITVVSDQGRAPKNDPAIFALAIAASAQNPDAQGVSSVEIRRHALDHLPQVCRIPTHLFHFLEYTKQLRRWSRMLRTAVADWYRRWDANRLAFELLKYQQRDRWSHKDALRLSHAKLAPEHQAALRWAVGAGTLEGRVVARKTQGWPTPAHPDVPPREGAHYQATGPLPPIIAAFEEAKTADTPRLVRLIHDHGLSREMMPSEALNSVSVWEALLEAMPPEAMIRSLAKMTAVGLLAPLGVATATVTQRLADEALLRKKRIHPMAVLNALRVYASGQGEKGKLTWTPVREVVDALDAAFYLCFGNVVPSNRRLLLALDVSASMDGSKIAGTALTAREAAAAMALVTAAVEPHYLCVGFTSGKRSRLYAYDAAISELAISPRQRLDNVIAYMQGLSFGGTDCALPMLYAAEKQLDVDAFITTTDSETWAGAVHPSQALRDYRAARGIAAKQVVVGMTATEFTIASPSDPLSLDVVGFDLATPQAISEFIGHAEARA